MSQITAVSDTVQKYDRTREEKRSTLFLNISSRENYSIKHFAYTNDRVR